MGLLQYLPASGTEDEPPSRLFLLTFTVPEHLEAPWLVPAGWVQPDGHLLLPALHSPIKIDCESLPRNLPFLMGLPSFPTSRWLELSHQISACLDKRFLRFSCRGVDVRKDRFAQSRTVVGKAEMREETILSALFPQSSPPDADMLPCKYSLGSSCPGSQGCDGSHGAAQASAVPPLSWASVY